MRVADDICEVPFRPSSRCRVPGPANLLQSPCFAQYDPAFGLVERCIFRIAGGQEILSPALVYLREYRFS